MKYPQLMSMPSALQDWLDEQLEARGIDAVVYTRYILSLLQRDTLDPPDDLRGRSWHVWDYEQLKRTAAVECLKSASDQKCGIEKLVDELCAKLKEIQSEGELKLSDTSVASSSSTPSPQDQAQKYYAAFPPLNSKFAESSKSLITLIPEAGVWSGKKVLAHSFGKNKCYATVWKEKKNWAEENKENNGNSAWKEIGRETMKSRSLAKEKEDCYGFAWNMAETGCRQLEEEEDLAQLIAKFDHSIEALWNPADDDLAGSSDNVSSSDEQERNARNSSFIQCGTNITSSIWSDREETREWVDMKWSGDSGKVGIYNSLNTLNHNREGSSFTEVIPKTRTKARTNESNVKQTRDNRNETVEEDLLTSTRTHFRPIRNDSLDSHNGHYADGTTFVIPTSLDEVAFRRSDSGALYLEAETGLETPKKYMEYKEKEDDEEFVPKFRVRQNEKCCQTEEADEEVDVKRSRHDTKTVNEAEDFFFPDDKQLADKMEETTELPMNNTPCQLLQHTKHYCIKCDQHVKLGWLESPSSMWQDSWYTIWKTDLGEEVTVDSKSLQYSRLREELTKEGEQLLSDLSYMQHLYQDDMDDENKPVFESSSPVKMLKQENWLSQDIWTRNERPFKAKALQKERKRRHSVSDRACIPCRFWADAARPVTL